MESPTVCSHQFHSLTLHTCRYVTNKEKFYKFLAAGLKSEKAEDEKISGEAPADGAEEPGGEPETKKRKFDDEQTQDKKKRRGQNKSRPHLKPHSYEERRLCPSVIPVFTHTHTHKHCYS